MPSRETQPKTLVVGASGQVGGRMLQMLGHSGDGSDVLATGREDRRGWLKLDLGSLNSQSQAEAVLGGHRLKSIFCVGGMTNVDGCEQEQETAHRTNAIGPGVLAAYAFAENIPFVYFSTEYVFDGMEDHPGPYLESDVPNPINVYGRSKLAGERHVTKAHPGALILRTTVVYGPDTRGMNFLYSVIRNLSKGQGMSVPNDQISTPTYNDDLVGAAMELVKAGASGIYNVVGPERINRYEFARQIADHFDLDPTLLRGVSTASLQQKAPRPLFAGLSHLKLQQALPHRKMRTAEEALASCSSELLSAFPSLRQSQGTGRVL